MPACDQEAVTTEPGPLAQVTGRRPASGPTVQPWGAAAQRGAPFLLGSSSASRSARACACWAPALWAAAVASGSIWA